VLISTQKQEFNIVMEKNDKTDTRRALTWLEFTQGNSRQHKPTKPFKTREITQE
jgi:hypothetical protein